MVRKEWLKCSFSYLCVEPILLESVYELLSLLQRAVRVEDLVQSEEQKEMLLLEEGE